MMDFKKQIKKLMIFVFIMACMLLICGMSVYAAEEMCVYNKNEYVPLSHDIFTYKEQYYIHIDDLESLGLGVVRNGKKYIISSNDCLGMEKSVTITPMSDINDEIIIELSASEDKPVVKSVFCDISWYSRSEETMGYNTSISIPGSAENSSDSGSGIIFDSGDNVIKVDDELYIAADFIGEKLSHKFSQTEGRIDYYFTDLNSVITETTLNLVHGTVAPEGGFEINIYTAYKKGSGNTIEDFEILSGVTCIINQNDSDVSCIIETPSQNIVDKNIYFIADFGNRYEFFYNEYDFSSVGKIRVYGQYKNVMHTVNIILPEAENQDVPFTVYLEVDGTMYSEQGVVACGEKSAVLKMEQMPVGKRYKSKIKFDYHKYKNAYMKDFELLNKAYAKDISYEYTAVYSKKHICTVSLPEDFVPEDDVTVRVSMKKYVPENSLIIYDDMTDWTDVRIIVLNKDIRSQQVILYSQAASSQLSYNIVANSEGLCVTGYPDENGGVTSEQKQAKVICEDSEEEITLLRRKMITVNVLRPETLTSDNDIYAVVQLNKVTDQISRIEYIKYTDTPLIPSGKTESEFQFEIIEDNIYELKISDIMGDERLFNYCCYVKPDSSPVQENKKAQICYDDEYIELTLIKCNNISGNILCETGGLSFFVTAVCELYNGVNIELETDKFTGEFELKIPEGTVSYTLDVRTLAGKKCYYISDNVSSYDYSDVSRIFYVQDDDKFFNISYVFYNPPLPIKVSFNGSNLFTIENISDCSIDNYEVYVTYYDMSNTLLYIDKKEYTSLASGSKKSGFYNNANYDFKKIRVLIWKNDYLTPLAAVSEKDIN